MAPSKSDLLNKAEEYFSYMVQVRRHLHKNPEISFKEFDTTDFILNELHKLGIETKRPLETGCVGIIEGGLAGKTIALRGDIDALPMNEEGDAKKEFISERPGAAHCCGHDFHTANLLGAAKILTDYKDEIEGRVILVFQPAEEKLPGGGRLLSETGILQELGVDEIYGLHTDPTIEPGQIGIKSGALMACTVEFEVEIIGKGGHAAAPHTAIDPIVTAAQVIQQFQTIVSRSLEPTEPGIITVGRIEAGSAHNIISEKLKMWGTVRAFSLETVRFIKKRMEEILKGVTRAAGGDYTFQFVEGYPAVINDEKCTAKLDSAAQWLMEKENVIHLSKPVMVGEDFSFYQNHFPGAFFFLGSGSKKTDSQYTWHHPKYNVDEEAFKTGAALMAGILFSDNN